MQRRRRCGLLPATCRGADKGGVSLFQKEIPLPYTLPEKICIASEQLEELRRLPIATGCARRSRVERCYTTCLCSTTRCCAAVGGSAALRMRHTPCGCRSAYLAQVQPNHYLPIVPTNAASAAMLPWQAPASPITSEVDGNCVRPTNRRQSGSEDRRKSNRLDTKNSRHSIPQAAQLFKRPTANAGVEGDSPRLSLGDQKGVFSSEREYPLLFAPLHGAGIYHPAWCRRNLISLPEPSA